MSVKTRPSSQAAIAEVYEDLEADIRTTARQVARRYNQEPEEVLSEARLIFMEAYHGYEQRQSGPPVGTRVHFLIWSRLVSRIRLDGQRAAKLKRQHRRLDGLPTEPSPEPFDRGELLAALSKDARRVVNLLLDNPPTEFLVRGRPATPHQVRVRLRQHLRRRGWDTPRVDAAFAEIKEVIQ